MPNLTTFDKVSNILEDQLGLEAKEITLTANLIDDLGADSLDCIELVMECEETFKVSIPDDDAAKLLTVADFVQYLDKRNKG